MKKLLILIPVLGTLLFLGGCDLINDSQNDELLEKISILENQINDLKLENEILDIKTEDVSDKIKLEESVEKAISDNIDSDLEGENKKLKELVIKYKELLSQEKIKKECSELKNTVITPIYCAEEGEMTDRLGDNPKNCCNGLDGFLIPNLPEGIGIELLCYDKNKGQPKCTTNGWYYDNGTFLFSDNCILTTSIQGHEVTDTLPIPQKTYLYFYLVNEDPNLSNDNPKKLIAITYEDNIYGSIEESIDSALKKLFSIKTFNYGESGYSNFLYKSNLTVISVTNDGTKQIIKINGDIVGISSMADYLLKQQIIRTIEEYSTNYEIILNGSIENWDCELDASGLCN